jgi:hypothetical protein
MRKFLAVFLLCMGPIGWIMLLYLSLLMAGSDADNQHSHYFYGSISNQNADK